MLSSYGLQVDDLPALPSLMAAPDGFQRHTKSPTTSLQYLSSSIGLLQAAGALRAFSSTLSTLQFNRICHLASLKNDHSREGRRGNSL